METTNRKNKSWRQKDGRSKLYELKKEGTHFSLSEKKGLYYGLIKNQLELQES